MTAININQDLYLAEIGKYLPYGKQKNTELLDTIREDLVEQDITQDFHSNYGLPKEVAKNLVTIHQDSLHDAGWLIRLIAFTIDMLLLVGAGILVIYLPFIVTGEYDLAEKFYDDTLDSSDIGLFWYILLMIYLAITLLFIISYFFFMEPLFATTIGKKIFGLRVIDESGIKITWKQSFVRNIVKIQGEFLPFDIILGWLMRNEQGGNFRRATEIAANTRVVVIR